MRAGILVVLAVVLVAGCQSGGAGAGDDDDGFGGRGEEACDPPGFDEDGDGAVDEGCGCERGETQACFPGPSATAGVGACRMGTQTCATVDEFSGWGDCVGAVGPTSDRPDDGVDSDCGGSDAPDDPSTACIPNEYGEGCFNNRDEDCDGLVDCYDPDCAAKCGEAGCVAEICENDIDDDCDGLVGCLDPSCGEECGTGAGDGYYGNPVGGGDTCLPQGSELCWDGRDDDCDGQTDCADADCEFSSECGCTEVCVPGQARWCDTPVSCLWGRQVCDPDGSWGRCDETTEHPGTCTSRFYDPTCCAGVGDACCQDYPSDGSIGECAGITACR